MQSSHLWHRFTQVGRQRGWVLALSLVPKNLLHLGRHWIDSRFDRRWGTDTCGLVPVAGLGLPLESAGEAVYFEATPVPIFEDIVHALDLDPGAFEFWDLGSGKGRNVLLAATLGFGRCCGVELSPSLHETAVRNVQRLFDAGRLPKPPALILGDAATVDFGDRDVLVFAYNPFGASVMSRVLRNLTARADRRIVFVYYNPQPQLMLAFPLLQLQGEVRLRHAWERETQRRVFVYANFRLAGRGRFRPAARQGD